MDHAQTGSVENLNNPANGALVLIAEASIESPGDPAQERSLVSVVAARMHKVESKKVSDQSFDLLPQCIHTIMHTRLKSAVPHIPSIPKSHDKNTTHFVLILICAE